MKSPLRRAKAPNEISERFIKSVCEQLLSGRRIRKNLPLWGRVHIDRPLPFLCIYRKPATLKDDGTFRLATTEASYIICSAKKSLQPSLKKLVTEIMTVLSERFGACVLVELWASKPGIAEAATAVDKLKPSFTLFTAKSNANGSITEAFNSSLSKVRLGKQRAIVSLNSSGRYFPRALQPLIEGAMAMEIGCHLYGLEVAPCYRDEETQEVFPLVLRQFRHQLTVALRRTFYRFSNLETSHEPAHYHSMGRRAVVKAVWEADRALAEVSEQYDFILLTSPVNGDSAWLEFKRNGYRKKPSFHYRPLPADPVVLKRQLFKAPVERVEDPALGQIFLEKLDETDRQITMLNERNTARFLPASLQLYGGVERELYELAIDILVKTPPKVRSERFGDTMSAEEFAELCHREILKFKSVMPGIGSRVSVSDEVTGLITVKGSLLIGKQTRIPVSRAVALLQHEVGTHILTYMNGRAQRFRQLYAGLAGYESLQEGLAVLAEYLVGGLTKSRLRLLAGRVVAVQMLLDGESFLEIFHELNGTYKFPKRISFNIAMRTCRSGGLTKDAIYLRGLLQILDYLGKGGDLRLLTIGKVAIHHISVIKELKWRGVLNDPPLKPMFLEKPDAQVRFEKLKIGLTPLELLN